MLTSKIKVIWERDFSRYVIILTSGTLLAQLIPILISPILTRLYSPEDFALLAFYLAVANFFVVIATLRYEQAILLPKDDEDALSIVALCMLVLLFISTVSLFVVYFFGESLSVRLGQAEYAVWLLLIPLSVLATGFYRIMINWTNRFKQYKAIAIGKVLQTGSTATTNVSFGFQVVHGGLIFGELLGHLFAGVTLCFHRRKELIGVLRVSFSRVGFHARKYADFAKVNTPHVLVDTVQSSGIVFILVSFFGDTALGMYALMMRVLMAPVSMVGSSVAQVFYKQASDVYNQGGDVGHLMRSTTYKLALCSWPLFFGFTFVAPDVFQFVFGEQWRQAGEYAQWLMPWIAIHFVVMPVMQLPMIYDKQRAAFLFGLVGNSLMLGAVFYGGYINDLVLGFMLLSACMVAYFIVLYVWLRSLCQLAPQGTNP